jgi:hypothetical protein
VAAPPNIGMVSQPLRGCGVICHVPQGFSFLATLGFEAKPLRGLEIIRKPPIPLSQ